MIQGIYAGPEEDEGVKYANNCEACKVLAIELQARLRETGKTSEVLQLGYSVDDVVPRKQKKYVKSELRFIESLEGLCDRILEYNIHKERTDSTRFAKGMSQTFQTLHGLVDKGVKVELGIPYELWDKPSVEITNMKSQCETLLEEYEDDLREWYEADAEADIENRVELIDYLCVQKVLKNKDSSCLREKGDTGKSIESDNDEVKKSNNDSDDDDDEDRKEKIRQLIKEKAKEASKKDSKKTKKSKNDKANDAKMEL